MLDLLSNYNITLMTKTLGPERYGDSLEVLLNFSSSNVKNNSYKINSLYASKDDIIAPWIIQKIREMEEKKKRQEDQPRVYIDDYPYEQPKKEEKDEKESDRGVIIIDINDSDKDYFRV